VILPGVIASSGGVASSFESIATASVGSGGSSSISFSNIPSTFTHLQIRGIAKSTNNGSVLNAVYIQCNSDTASNYSFHYLYGYAAAVGSGGGATQTFMYPAFIPLSDTSYTSMFGSLVIDILDYKDTNKYKTIRALSGMDLNNINSFSGDVVLGSGNWRSTSAISSIQITTSTGNFAQYSSLALYGVKA
jgi:hypothetical protein